MVPSLAIVKALLVQHSGTLWIGTKTGHILLVDVSSCQLLQTFSPHCDSIRCMGSAVLGTLSVSCLSSYIESVIPPHLLVNNLASLVKKKCTCYVLQIIFINFFPPNIIIIFLIVLADIIVLMK